MIPDDDEIPLSQYDEDRLSNAIELLTSQYDDQVRLQRYLDRGASYEVKRDGAHLIIQLAFTDAAPDLAIMRGHEPVSPDPADIDAPLALGTIPVSVLGRPPQG